MTDYIKIFCPYLFCNPDILLNNSGELFYYFKYLYILFYLLVDSFYLYICILIIVNAQLT